MKLTRDAFIGIITKHKKLLLILVFFVGYIIFWVWFFSERDIKIEEKGQEDVVQKEAENKDEDDNSFGDLGNFWIEINTDSIQIKAPIVDGVTDEKLDIGVGHHKTTAFPNNKEGNVVISGHRWKLGNNPAYKVFEDLDELEIGDYVTLHYQGENFKYKVIEEKIVDDEDVEILEQTDQPILTLYTCTPKRTALRRLVYRAQLVDK